MSQAILSSLFILFELMIKLMKFEKKIYIYTNMQSFLKK